PLIERSRADCVDRNGHARFVCERNFPQIHRDVEVVEKTAPTEDEQVELLDLRSRLLARHLAHGHCTIYSVSSERVFGIARENCDRTDARNAAQLCKDAMEDRLVAEIDASVCPGDPNAQPTAEVRRHVTPIHSGNGRFLRSKARGLRARSVLRGRRACKICRVRLLRSVAYRPAPFVSSIARTQTQSGLEIDLDALAVAAEAEHDVVSAGLQQLDRVGRQSIALQPELVRNPLMMEAWSVDRLLNVEIEIDDVDQDVRDRRDDRRAAGRAQDQPELAVLEN